MIDTVMDVVRCVEVHSAPCASLSLSVKLEVDYNDAYQGLGDTAYTLFHKKKVYKNFETRNCSNSRII